MFKAIEPKSPKRFLFFQRCFLFLFLFLFLSLRIRHQHRVIRASSSIGRENLYRQEMTGRPLSMRSIMRSYLRKCLPESDIISRASVSNMKSVHAALISWIVTVNYNSAIRV